MSNEPNLKFHGVPPTATLWSWPRPLTLLFSVFWFAGVCFAFTLSYLQYLQSPANTLPTLVFPLIGLILSIPVLWVLSGKRERMFLHTTDIVIERGFGPFKFRHQFSKRELTIIGIQPPDKPALVDFDAICSFFTGGAGTIVFHVGDRNYSFGHGLSAIESYGLAVDISQHVPSAAFYEPRQAHLLPTPRGVFKFIPLFVAAGLGLIPYRLPFSYIRTDLPICFYDDSELPDDPIDLTLLSPKGEVLLVPIGKFPEDQAQAIADHFRSRFQVPIQVAPSLPADTMTTLEGGKQWDARAVLRDLRNYKVPESDTVVIGLTDHDINNPEYGWRYVFGDRDSESGIAVASTAQMVRGCLDLGRAEESRIVSRLRKMVGKQIGILYFKLEPNFDEHSMLYNYISGPQELDVIGDNY